MPNKGVNAKSSNLSMSSSLYFNDSLSESSFQSIDDQSSTIEAYNDTNKMITNVSKIGLNSRKSIDSQKCEICDVIVSTVKTLHFSPVIITSFPSSTATSPVSFSESNFTKTSKPIVKTKKASSTAGSKHLPDINMSGTINGVKLIHSNKPHNEVKRLSKSTIKTKEILNKSVDNFNDIKVDVITTNGVKNPERASKTTSNNNTFQAHISKSKYSETPVFIKLSDVAADNANVEVYRQSESKQHFMYQQMLPHLLHQQILPQIISNSQSADHNRNIEILLRKNSNSGMNLGADKIKMIENMPLSQLLKLNKF
jgi:hypothetical protein